MITIKNLHKKFGSKTVLNGIDLEVAKGESLVVIGGSGTGKSVLLKSILGLIQADSGSIKLDGTEMVGASAKTQQEQRGKFGMLFQGGALFDSLPVWHNVCFQGVQTGEIDKTEAHDMAVEQLRAVGLAPDVAWKFPAELSGGMQKRVALARAVASQPEIVFFDEPTTGLDPIMADVINDLIVASSKRLGATTLTITHDMASCRKIADRVAMIHEGKIIWHDKIAKLDTTKDPYIKQFINGQADGPMSVAT